MLLGALVLLGGCDRGQQATGVPSPKQGGTVGRRFEKATELAPEASFGKEAHLVLGGTRIPVQVKETRKGDQLSFDFVSHGQPIEVERYQFTLAEFALVEATMEIYEPALPLLKFPMRVGDSWEWTGKLRTFESAKEASAVITTGVAPIFTAPGTEAESVRTEVRLTIVGVGPKPSEKKLVFYFIPGKGLVKREFGFASTREPVQASL